MTTTSQPLDSFEERLLQALRAVVVARGGGASNGAGRRIPRWSRGVVASVTVCCTLGTFGGLAVAGTFSGGTIGPQAWVDGQRVLPEATITPDQNSSLAVLSLAPSTSDALDPYDSQALTNSPAASDGANVALSRRVVGFSSGAAWVVPANDGIVCLVAENAEALQMHSEPGPWQQESRVPGANGATSCTAASAVGSGWSAGYSTTSDTPDLDFTAGFVPAGVDTVSVTTTSGSTIALPVYENVYMGEVPSTTVSVGFQGPSGLVTLSGVAPHATNVVAGGDAAG